MASNGGCVIRDSNGVTVCCVRTGLDFTKRCLWACKLEAKQRATTVNDEHIFGIHFQGGN